MAHWMVVIFYFIYWDFLAYIFHRICHRVDLFWKMHKYHHSTIYFTGFSAYRVSFLENGMRICFYTIFLLPVISAFAEPPLWIGYILSVFTFVKHNEFFCKRKFNWWPEFLIQSPKMHWLHHSLDGPYGKNFAEVLSLWDILFRTHIYSDKHKQVNFEAYKIGVKDRISPNYIFDIIDVYRSIRKK